MGVAPPSRLRRIGRGKLKPVIDAVFVIICVVFKLIKKLKKYIKNRQQERSKAHEISKEQAFDLSNVSKNRYRKSKNKTLAYMRGFH